MKVLEIIDCPSCGSKDFYHEEGEIRCDCNSCGFWWNEYVLADE